MKYKRKPIDFKINDDNCFVVTSHAVGKNGYITISVNMRKIYIHRFIYEEFFGEIPKGHMIRHKCDNRLCVNPEHLETGTAADNMMDKVLRGRQPRGEKAGRSILNEKDVLQIRKEIKTINRNVLAKKYNVHPATIDGVVKRRNWKHV